MKNPWSQAADCLRTLSHPHRLQMVDLLLEKERKVGELAKACKILSHVASEHLQLLKAKGLLSSQRKGKCVYYFVSEEALASILKCVRNRFFKR
ncbi:MAG: winged helix-turn-helix transcriptional regulator [Verrucomicrobia bacterium]|nr:winged helix-turn-helix transcriptional regulator [Verrucomicrobiota bacterium]